MVILGAGGRDTPWASIPRFAPHSYFMGAAENLQTERFTRVADVLNYEITFEDSTTWAKSWTALVRLKRTGARIYESACHEGTDVSRECMAFAAPSGTSG